MNRRQVFVSGSALALVAAFRPRNAFAGVEISVRFEAPPPLVVVSPGIQVVEDNDEEVFFTDGFYWVRRDDVWYRTRDHRGGWAVVGHEHVPAFIYQAKPGAYRHWKHEEHERHEEHREEKHEEEHAEKHEAKKEKHHKDKH
jgi:hypothetical protein